MRDSLNEREQAILERLSNGLSDQQIADETFLSLNTVKWYNRHIYSKLDPAAFASAWAEGRAMTLEQAVALAMDATELGKND